ncbi:MAG: hypothetical protein CYG60_13810 [Actinobacteria bacterium]|nr:MAG: hypothetical protein CYG60_13810 [Actinomycetota bacterium]
MSVIKVARLEPESNDSGSLDQGAPGPRAVAALGEEASRIPCAQRLRCPRERARTMSIQRTYIVRLIVQISLLGAVTLVRRWDIIRAGFVILFTA